MENSIYKFQIGDEVYVNSKLTEIGKIVKRLETERPAFTLVWIASSYTHRIGEYDSYWQDALSLVNVKIEDTEIIL